jgi:4-hydroxybenzoate polyprenyltransferase
MCAFVELLHPLPVLFVMSAAVLFGLLATGGRPNPLRFALLLVALFGGQAAIGALNEYHDRTLDARVKPERPIPSGRVSPRFALAFARTGLIALAIAGALLGLVPLLLAAAGTGAGIAYDYWFKGTALSWLPYLLALPLLPIWAWLCLSHFDPTLLVLYPIGAPIVIAVHLAQSLPDAASDRAEGVRGLAARLGAARAFWVICLATTMAAVEVAIIGIALGKRPDAALLAAFVCIVAVSLAILARRRDATYVDRHVFPLIAGVTVLLGFGLVVALVA